LNISQVTMLTHIEHNRLSRRTAMIAYA